MIAGSKNVDIAQIKPETFPCGAENRQLGRCGAGDENRKELGVASELSLPLENVQDIVAPIG